MALLHSFEKSGNFLFRYRSYLPLFLFLPAIPVVWFTPVFSYPQWVRLSITFLSVALSLLGFLIRAWAIGTTPKGTSGRNTDKQLAESLNHLGIYSMVRHPLYLGNYFMWIGIVVFTGNPWFVILVSLAFWLYYERIMFAEERFLERQFGESYLSWASQVPAFIPRFSLYQHSDIRFSLVSVLRREYSGVLATVTCFFMIDMVRSFLFSGSFQYYRISAWAFLFTLVITLAVRTLKHHSSLLSEEGRS